MDNKMWLEIQEQPDVIRNCLTANEEKLNQIADVVKNKNIKYIVAAARGSSDHAAVYGKYMIEILSGYPVVLSAPSVFTVYGASMKFEDALVLGISQSGEAEDILSVLRAAKAYGAPTVGITNEPESPIAKEVDCCLDCSAGQEKSVAATKTFTAQMCLLGMLAIKLSGNKEDEKLFAKIPEQISAVFGMAEKIQSKAVQYCFAEDMIVLGRGLEYCIALESALKVEETTYVRAKGFAASDFYHGPIAVVHAGLPILTYAMSGPAMENMRDLIKQLMDIGANVLVVSDNEKVCHLGTDFILLPPACSFLTAPFMDAVTAQ